MEHVVDRDGRVLAVHDVTARDTGAVDGLLRRLSVRSSRQRFLCSTTTAGPLYAETLTDAGKTMDALVVQEGPDVVGVGSTHPLTDDCVEFALAVDDAHQGHGIGTLLVERLVARAQERGVRSMTGTALGGNSQIFDVLRHLGLPWRSIVEDGIATVTVSIDGQPVMALPAHLVRAEAARVEAVRPFLSPSTIAVLRPAPTTTARKLLPHHPEVAVAEIGRGPGGFTVPEGTDLALVPGWVDDAGAAALACAEAGVPAIALLASSRTRRRGAAHRDAPLADDEMERLREHGARVLGPGCGWLVNTDPLVRLQVGGGRRRAGSGSVAVITDDATCLDQLLAQLASRSMGVSVVVDVGRSCDLEVQDVAAWVAVDGRTEVVLVKLAGELTDALRSQLARVHACGKPVAVLAPVGPQAVDDVPARGAGPVRADSLADLADLAMLLVLQGLPPGCRVAVVTNEPGNVEAGATRQLARRAMLGASLTQHTEMRIHFLTPGSTSQGPVVALPPDTTAAQVRDVLQTLADDPGVDAVVVDHAPSAGLRQSAFYRALGGLARGPRSPVLVAVDPHGSRDQGGVPLFTSVGTAVDALARVCRA